MRSQKTLMPAMDLTRRLYKVTFDHPAAELLAKGDAARRSLDHALNVATVALCAEMTGGMQRMLDIAVEYAKTRKQFGKPIGQYQAVQHQCADMLLFTESSRSAAYYAAWTMTEGIDRGTKPRRRQRRQSLCERCLPRNRQSRRAGARRHGLHLGERYAPVLPPRQSKRNRFRRRGLPSGTHRQPGNRLTESPDLEALH